MADQDINQPELASMVKITGSAADGTEQTPVESTATKELKTHDVANNGGVDDVITIAPGGVVELIVGGSANADRKYVQIQALGRGVKWGFSNTTQSFEAFRNQFFILPFGPNTSVFLTNTSATNSDVAIAEVS